MEYRKFYNNKAQINKKGFYVWQDYASTPYVYLFMVLMLILLVKLSQNQEMLAWGVGGVFGVALGANAMAAVKMKRDIAYVVAEGSVFYIISVYDHVMEQKVEAFPVSYSSPRMEQNRLAITFHDRVVMLKPEDYDNWPALYNYFFGIDVDEQGYVSTIS